MSRRLQDALRARAAWNEWIAYRGSYSRHRRDSVEFCLAWYRSARARYMREKRGAEYRATSGGAS